MEKKTIKRMLRKRLFHIFYPDQHEENEYIKSRLDMAVTDIKARLTERLPKEKEILQPALTAYRYGKITAHGIWLYNQALADVRGAIEGI